MLDDAVRPFQRRALSFFDVFGRRSTRRIAVRTFAAMLGCGLLGCSDSSGLAAGGLELAFDFSKGMQGWVADFADYPVGTETEWAIGSSLAPLPAPLDPARSGVRLTGDNHSDDLFMYVTRALAGLTPNASYGVRFRVTLATNAPKGCAGIGGSPGESVVLKVGATDTEPGRVVDVTGHYRANFDYGAQLGSGKNAVPVGNLATTNTDCLLPRYELKDFDSGAVPLTYAADGTGRLWLIVGIDSGYEGMTTAYVTYVRVYLSPR